MKYKIVSLWISFIPWKTLRLSTWRDAETAPRSFLRLVKFWWAEEDNVINFIHVSKHVKVRCSNDIISYPDLTLSLEISSDRVRSGYEISNDKDV